MAASLVERGAAMGRNIADLLPLQDFAGRC